MLETFENFKEKIEYFNTKYQEYQGKLNYHYNNAKNLTVRKEYARGGEVIHRGYYCPSPVLDKIVGNCKRGKLIKTPRKMPDYEYWIDSDNKIILIKKYCHEINTSEIEILLYSTNSVDSVIYQNVEDDPQNLSEILVLSRCIFDNKELKTYDVATMLDNLCLEINTENYEYNGKRLISSTIENYNIDLDYLFQNQYFYNYDTNNNMISYTTKQYYNGGYKPSIHDNITYDLL